MVMAVCIILMDIQAMVPCMMIIMVMAVGEEAGAVVVAHVPHGQALAHMVAQVATEAHHQVVVVE
ncbi:hypothetical protein AZ09_01965 [Acetobacter aceti 1023]|nr:hypothetical protein AZ09_01965 [Acetobacter aceti 1023]